MKLTIYRRFLIKALKSCNRARATWQYCDRNNIDLVFSGYIFQTTADCNDCVSLTTCNTKWSIREHIPCSIDEPENHIFAIAEVKLAYILQSLDCDYIDLVAEKGILTIKYSEDTIRIPFLENPETANPETAMQLAEDILNAPTSTVVYDVDTTMLRDNISRLQVFTDNEWLRPALQGVCLNATKDHFDMVASNGAILLRIRQKPLKGVVFNTIIPGDIAKRLAKLLPAKDVATLSIQPYSDKEDAPMPVCIIRFGCTTIGIKTTPEKYVNYDAVFPKEIEYEAEFNKNHLLNSLKIISMLCPFEETCFEFTFKNHAARIRSGMKGFYDTDQYIPCSYEGKGERIAFNSNRISSILRHISTPDILFQSSGCEQAALVKPVPAQTDEEVTFLAMPMHKEDEFQTVQ